MDFKVVSSSDRMPETIFNGHDDKNIWQQTSYEHYWDHSHQQHQQQQQQQQIHLDDLELAATQYNIRFDPTSNEYDEDNVEVIPVDPECEYTDEDVFDSGDSDEEEIISPAYEVTASCEVMPSASLIHMIDVTPPPEEEDEPMPTINYANMGIAEFTAAMQQSGHRINRKSMSLPHSPLHYSPDLSGISLDDLDILAPTTAPDVTEKTFDLASYITEDDNFEVISPLKEYKPPSALVNNSPKKAAAAAPPSETVVATVRRTCAISAKKMHYNAIEPDVKFQSSDEDDEVEDVYEAKSDNPKTDPTWMPCPAKPQVPVVKIQKTKEKTEKKVKKEIKVKKTEKKLKKSEPTKHLTKITKSSQKVPPKTLTKEKVHKIATKTVPLMGKSVKLDHDYCTGKRVPPTVQRKAIEIPIIDPALDLKPKSKVKSKPPKHSEERKQIVQSPPIAELRPAAVATVKRKLNVQEYFERHRAVETSRPVLDPILEAKRKMLRRQELKKQAKLQESEPKIETVPLLTILPLAQITGMHDPEPAKVLLNPDYEEIVSVSMGCNTEVTVPPSEHTDNLYAYIENSMQKVAKTDKTISKHSLIAGIQDTVLKATHIDVGIHTPALAATAPGKTPDKPDGARVMDDAEEHGEDKIITHLRKDRKRPDMRSMGVQTVDMTPFNTMRPHDERVKTSRSRSMTRSRSRRNSSSSSSSSSTSSSSSSSSDSSSDRSSSSSSERSRRSYRSRSNFKRHKYSRSPSPNSRSFPSSRSQSKSRDSDYRRREPLRRNPEDPEKRNVVYVGRIDSNMTRDELKEKFSDYGYVRNVTIHSKPNGLHYGFVTFDKPEQAYNAIDNSSADPNIKMYDVSFGGRRAFCKSQYADLDGLHTYVSYHGLQYAHPVERNTSYMYSATKRKEPEDDSFESLLNQFKSQINKQSVRES